MTAACWPPAPPGSERACTLSVHCGALDRAVGLVSGCVQDGVCAGVSRRATATSQPSHRHPPATHLLLKCTSRIASLWNLCACATRSAMCMWPRSRAFRGGGGGGGGGGGAVGWMGGRWAWQQRWTPEQRLSSFWCRRSASATKKHISKTHERTPQRQTQHHTQVTPKHPPTSNLPDPTTRSHPQTSAPLSAAWPCTRHPVCWGPQTAPRWCHR